MAKNVFFSEETMKGINKLVTTENGRVVIDYGKGNFLLGSVITVGCITTCYSVYQMIKCGCHVVKYLRQ